MAYVRKTRDRWDIETNYGYGWETEHSVLSFREAKQAKADYLINSGASVRIVKRREKIEEARK